MDKITLVECPRDAMQGWAHFIPTNVKIEYLNQLLKVGFDILDFGSFVNPKAIPQMADTVEVLSALDLSQTHTKLLAIVANLRGAQDASQYKSIQYLGFPFSISETFQLRNTNKTIAESLQQVEEIQNLAVANDKEVVIYISMGFGNPYGDPYSASLAIDWVGKIHDLGIRNFAMSDTVGVANPENIEYIFSNLIPAFPDSNIGAHFHSTPYTRIEKIESAYRSGCRSFDSSIHGVGGCPMAKDVLVGNMATEVLIAYFEEKGLLNGLNKDAFFKSMEMASKIFI